MKWSSDIINKVRESHDLVDWVSKDTVLKNRFGGEYFGLCPFSDHKEKTPSFSVSSSKQVYHCFGCGRGGNIFNYFKDQKGMGFYETLIYLAQQAGIELKRDKNSEANLLNRNRLLKINQETAAMFHQELMKLDEKHKVHSYLKTRGYSQSTIKKFLVGYSSGKLSKHLSGEQKEMALKLGLLRKSPSGVFDMFRGRLMFPIISHNHQVVGFGARALDSSQPKYINNRESECFKKGTSLYGLNETGAFIRQKGCALMVEGYTDFLTLFQNGFTNIAATLGTALTSHHARLLKRYTNKIILFFDGDSAGKKAELRSLPLLLSEGLRVHHVRLEGMDPDECIKKKGASFLKKALEESQDLFLYMFFDQLKNIPQGFERIDWVQEISPILSSVKNQKLKEYYTQKIKDAFLPKDEKALKKALEKGVNSNLRYQRMTDSSTKEVYQKDGFFKISLKKFLKPELKKELHLLVLALSEEEYLKFIRVHLNLNWLSSLDLRRLFRRVFEDYDRNPEEFEKLLSKISSQAEPANLLQVEAHRPFLEDLKNVENGKSFVEDYIKWLSLKHKKLELNDQVLQVKLGASDDKKYLKEIQKKKRSIFNMEKHHEK